MTAPSVKGLARFREGETRPRQSLWEPPSRFADDTVLVFDQSLSATGWVVLEGDQNVLTVLTAGSIRLRAADFPGGHEGTLLKAMAVADQVDSVVDRLARVVSHVVHEEPPLAVGRMTRPESSLLAALCVRLAAERARLRVSTVQNQHSKKVLTGASREVTKKQWHAGLDRLTIVGRDKATNEGERDALCLGVTYLAD